eukprot:TRINITY_DN19319_c0_g1_i1.p1 TRINITY_DN19319_c0_g1~~TRINITY_DN19319_c0_g1_i1.p1  ORF type:complete len:189 (+),score=31.52 TRINITY_DN19319_c0_g1_i1:54-620(+)
MAAISSRHTSRTSDKFSEDAIKPPAPLQQLKPPRPPGTQPLQPHIQSLQSESRTSAGAEERQHDSGYPRLQPQLRISKSDCTPHATALEASIPSSSASTRTPSPGSAAAAGRGTSLGGLELTSHGGSRPGSAASVGGQVAPPVRWKWQPRDGDRLLRERGEGASHLKGRRANLAKLREIQGLNKDGPS